MKIQECLEKITNVELIEFTPTYEKYKYHCEDQTYHTIWCRTSIGEQTLRTVDLRRFNIYKTVDNNHFTLLNFLRSKVQISPQSLKQDTKHKCTCPSRTLFNFGCKCGGI